MSLGEESKMNKSFPVEGFLRKTGSGAQIDNPTQRLQIIGHSETLHTSQSPGAILSR